MINYIKIFKLILKYPKLFKLVSNIFDTLNIVAVEGKARTQNIIIDFDNGKGLQEVINLWVCVGKDANPIIRIQELRKEVDGLNKKLNAST